MRNSNKTQILIGAALLAVFSLGSTPIHAQEARQARTMKLASFVPPVHFLTPHLEAFAQELGEASEGAITIDYYGAEALGKSTEAVDITVEGLADMALFCSIYTPSRFPLSSFVELPFFSNSAAISSKVVRALMDEGLINDEYVDFKLLATSTTAPAQIFARRKLERLEDFAGARLTGIGPVWTRTWSLLGGQAVSMGWPDIYLAMERGTIDAATTNWAASTGWKWQEVAEYPVDISIMGGFFCGIVMNNDSWRGLSADIQERWTEIADRYSTRFSRAYDEGDGAAKQKWQEAGRSIHVFLPEEKQRLAEALLPIWQDWFDENEAAGRPAREIYRTYVATMEALGEPVVMKLPGVLDE